MSSDPPVQAGGPIGGDPSGQAAQPSEEDRSEIGQRAAYEAELSRISSADMILQATVSLLNLAGRRLGMAPGASLLVQRIFDANGVEQPVERRGPLGRRLRQRRRGNDQQQNQHTSHAAC